MSSRNWQLVGERLLPAVAYGDAIGLPAEAKSAMAIAALYGTITELVSPQDNPYYPGNYPGGTTSDDTQLSVVTAQALLTADGFDLYTQAQGHVKVFHETPKSRKEDGTLSVRGWGGSTTASMERLIAGMSPQESGTLDGAGNGVVMKMGPLAYWQVARRIGREDRYRQYDELTTMTHDSEIARACTRMHGDILCWLMENPSVSMDEFRLFAQMTNRQEPVADDRGWIATALEQPSHNLRELIERYEPKNPKGYYGFFVPNTLAMAYDVFMAAEGDYKTAVSYAANLGGDADSIASITGVMATMWSGGAFVPPDDFERTQDYEKNRRLSVQLAQRALMLS